MTPHTGNQIIIIHIFPNILRSKSNHTMKFSQLIDTTGEIVFFKNHAGNTTGRLVPDLILFFFEKALREVKVSGQQLSFNIYW